MSVEFFLDTNVLIYAFEPSSPEKQKPARDVQARTLYTEDLQDGQVMEGLTVVDPFKAPVRH